VTRVIVLGGHGLFGRTIAEQLERFGIVAQYASRVARADLRVDANDVKSIRASILSGDLVIDAAGPFQHRTTALVEAAVEIGFDLIDINDSLDYAEKVLALEQPISAAGIRVLPSASSVSAVAAAILKHSCVTSPKRMTCFLAPASRHTARAGTALSLLNSVGRPIRLWRDGRLQSDLGWTEAKMLSMPGPIHTIRGRLFESADSLYLPRIWPTLREVTMYVDTNLPGMNTLLRLAAKSRVLRSALKRSIGLGSSIARRLGSSAGGLGYEIEDAVGQVVRYAIVAKRNSFLVAVAPAVLAAQSIVENRFSHRGLVLPNQHVEPDELLGFLRAAGITVSGPW
jgi:hypothetical protein